MHATEIEYQPPAAYLPERPDPRPFRLAHWVALAVAALLYSVYIIATWSHAYIDFGDGNYMYIASRIAEGGVVYRDILAPQPPAHLFLGALIVKISEWVGMDSPLYLFRAFSLLLRLSCFLLLTRLAWLAWGRATEAVLAGVLYLAMPIGIWWFMGYQSEPLEIFFLLAMMNFALRRTRAADVTTGIFGALAALTNATAAPFLLVLIIYMLARNWRRALWIALPALALAAVVTLVVELYSGGYFLQNAVLNQVGTYPPDFWSYALGKIYGEGADVLYRELLFIFFGLLGFFRFLHESPLDNESRGGLAWFCVATMASIVFVSKGGTMDYIFSLSEPAVALLAGGEVAALARRVFAPAGEGRTAAARTEAMAETGLPPGETRPRIDLVSSRLLKIAGLAFFALVAAFYLRPTVSFYLDLWHQTAFELPTLEAAGTTEDGQPAPNVDQVVYWIEQYSDPDDVILAPPFYAFLADRRIWGDFSEIFIWTIKDHNDRLAGDPEGEGWAKTRALADALRRREIPIAIIELDQTGRKPEVIEALSEHYRMLTPEPYRTLNTRLLVMVPRENASPSPPPGSGAAASQVPSERTDEAPVQ